MTSAVDVVAAQTARDLTDRIKITVDGAWQLIKQAYETRAWDALGYQSWDDYCTREFGTSRLRLPREERQEVVASLREIGMSVRAIASATGSGYGTVYRELAGDPNGSPARHHGLDEVLAEAGIDPSELGDDDPVIAGLDGKRYPATSTRPAQKPRTDVIATVNRVLMRTQEAAQAADKITRQHLAGRDDEVASWTRSLVESMQSLERLLAILEETQ